MTPARLLGRVSGEHVCLLVAWDAGVALDPSDGYLRLCDWGILFAKRFIRQY
jgi:hypothetical protein